MLLECIKRTLRPIAAIILAVGLVTNPTAAQNYPTRAVKFVVPFPAGGAMDVAMRILVSGMEPAFRVPLVVENRPGASGNIGTVQVTQSPADGHTLLLGIAANTSINRFLYKTLPFDVNRDLAPVAQFGSSTLRCLIISGCRFQTNGTTPERGAGPAPAPFEADLIRL